MKYKILSAAEFAEGDYKLLSLREGDIELIRVWRNEQIDVLRQKKPLTEKEQINYFRQVVRPTFAQKTPPLMLFSLLKNDSLIGYGGLVYLDWEARHGEVSFLVDSTRAKDKKTYAKDFSSYLTLLKRVAFDDLNLNRIFVETYATRLCHLEVLTKNGFIYEGRMRQHVKIKGKYIDSLIHGILKNDYLKK